MAVTSFIACLLALVNIGSVAAFNGVISVAIAGLFASYLLTSSLLLYRRCTGAIVSSNTSDHVVVPERTNEATIKAIWGPWRIPGVLGIANNAFACVYLTYVLFFSFWPSFADVTPLNMNWSILVTGVITLVSAVYYLVWARKTYHGPIVDIDILNAHEAHRGPE